MVGGYVKSRVFYPFGNRADCIGDKLSVSVLTVAQLFIMKNIKINNFVVVIHIHDSVKNYYVIMF